MRMRLLSESECYARCYGWRDDQVRIVRLEPRRPRNALRPSGEELRRERKKCCPTPASWSHELLLLGFLPADHTRSSTYSLSYLVISPEAF